MLFTRTSFRQVFVLAGLIAGGLTVTAPAHAGSCPADKMRADGSGQKMNPAAAKDVTDTVLGSIDLAGEPAAVKDRLLRLRRLVIQPGGVVPWHEHANRPAIIYIVSGEVTEYASTCAAPIVHRAGETAVETHATSHWWKNTGKQPVVLLSADLFPATASDKHMM